MSRVVILAVAIALAAGVGVAVPPAVSGRPGDPAHADDLAAARAQLEKAKSATWQTTYYSHFVSPDGQRHRWARISGADDKRAYKAPGLYRSENGDGRFLSIQDAVNRAKLDINPATKTATLTYLAEPDQG